MAAKGGGGVGSATVLPMLRTQTRNLRRQRLIYSQSLQDVVADFQDKFLLLENVLKV